jgi:nitric oxide reductase NorD protein
MEEWVGAAWDWLLRRVAHRGFPAAAVTLEEMRPVIAPYFRALGGDAGITVKSGSALTHTARRRWLERLAGTGDRVSIGWCDSEALYLPDRLDTFADTAMNRELYLWLATLAAFAAQQSDPDNWRRNVAATRKALAALPGWRARYARLVESCIALRSLPLTSSSGEHALEQAVRAQLRDPDADVERPVVRRSHWPVPLWLHFDNSPVARAAAASAQETERSESAADTDTAARQRLRAERVEMPEEKNGMLLNFRGEQVLTWAEYVRVNRPSEDDEDTKNALMRARDMDHLSVARDGKSAKSRVRFDLDLPSPDNDDTPLGPGIHLPEWHWREQKLLPDFCCLEPLLPVSEPLDRLPDALRASAARLHRQFEALAPQPMWRGRAMQGDEIDIDACLRFAADRLAGSVAEPGLWRERVAANRSLACLLLADLSLSTDTWVGERRVIDVIRDSLFLFSEAMSATRDTFGLYGFSSVKRQHVRLHVLKDFSERYGAQVRGRIEAIKPGFYTRMGAAIRHATNVLCEQPTEQRLLLLLTDGKPNDIDHYEGRYGIEDTRHAVRAARGAGMKVFCVTIDRDAADYLPHIFGTQNFVVAQDATQLPSLLPKLYIELTRRQ